MTPLDLFLREHSALHTRAVAGSPFGMDWLLKDLSDAQWRARPSGLNSLAWLVWHLARVEDSCVARVVVGCPQLHDADWAARLGAEVGDTDGEGMSTEQVTALSHKIDIAALTDYRDAVGRRTREIVPTLWPERWHTPFTAEALQFAIESGAVSGGESKGLVGAPREMLLTWWALHHSHYHLGQASLVRKLALQFGAGNTPADD